MIHQVMIITDKGNSTHMMETYELIKFLTCLTKSEEFKVGEKHYIPSEVKSFISHVTYKSKVSEADD